MKIWVKFYEEEKKSRIYINIPNIPTWDLCKHKKLYKFLQIFYEVFKYKNMMVVLFKCLYNIIIDDLWR